MTTLVGKQDDPIKLLHSLVELDYDAIEAYDAAIDRIGDATFKAQLSAFRDDHRNHVASLNAVLQEMGADPVVAGDIKRVLTKGKVILGALVGDKAILQAMKTNEDDTNTAYERAVGFKGFDNRVMSILNRNLSDERRHRAYIVQAIASLEKGRRPSEPRVSTPSFH